MYTIYSLLKIIKICKYKFDDRLVDFTSRGGVLSRNFYLLVVLEKLGRGCQ